MLKLAERFLTRHLGSLSKFLGTEFTRTTDVYYLSQQSYITELLHTASMTNCKPHLTPLPSKLPIDDTLTLPFPQPEFFRKLVGSLQFITSTRPDIAFAVNKLCQHMHSPQLLHFQLLKRVLRYLKGTISHALFLPKNELNLSAYSDSDWAGDQLDRKSTTGYYLYLGTALLTWSVKKQTTVARSSTKAEYRSMAAATTDIIWTRRLCEDFLLPQPTTKLFCDNISAMSIACNPIFHAHTKHIEVDHHFIRECIQANHIAVHHISTLDQVADIFTKCLSSSRLLELRNKLLVVPPVSLRDGDKQA
ncbi:putative mitochondrial protein [Dendrobium catenatum]|uniref:Putative mitochondrial protein n=1 Tax=Dendrobium catenatum TaxID=906689 RepID=A0A2I0XB50_9ASPA|nr:putative mitochondrial protein [Dendrobium catenatum]